MAQKPFVDIEGMEEQKPQVISQRQQVDVFISNFSVDGDIYPYRAQAEEFTATGAHSFVIDFGDLESWNNDLAVSLLQDPDSLLQDFKDGAIEAISAVRQGSARNLNIRFKHLTQTLPLRDVNVGLLDKMFAIAGIIVRVSERKNIMVDAAFVCPDGHTTNVKQETEEIKKPPSCCGENCKYLANNLELDQRNSKFLDYQMVRIQELPDELPAGQMPRGFDINMTDDVIDMVRPGDHVVITGILRAVKERGATSSKRRIFDSEIDCNFAEVKEKDAGSTDVTPADIEAIKEIAQKPDAYGRLVHSMVPAIMGHDDVKEAILLQLAGGVPINLPDGSKRRGDFHILLAGDPGVAKSENLLFANRIASRSVMANGRATSAAGLGAGIVKGPKDVPMLEVGVLPLADQGLACIDELDKMKAEDRSALHEAMEGQCYDDTTEILTESGWKLFKDLTPNDKVATLDNDRLGYVLPSKYIATNYSGDIYEIKSRQVNLVVTPNHNMYVNLNKRADEWVGFQLIHMQDIPIRRNMRFKKTAEWIGNRVSTFVIPSIVKSLNQKKKIMLPPMLVDMDTWLEFLGYYLSEGSYSEKNGVPYWVQIAQSSSANPEVKEQIRKCLGKMKLHFTETDTALIVSSKQLASYMKKFGGYHDKFVPFEIKQLPKDQLLILFNSLVAGDGTISKNTGHITYVTSSKPLADDFQEICLKLGMAANIYCRVKKGQLRNMPEGRMSYATSDIFEISVIQEEQCYPTIFNHSKRRNHIQKKKYVGKIFCVEVPSHLLYVRRNGKPVWCGNTVTYNKAGFHVTLNTRVSVLAACNPIMGTYNPNISITENINIIPSLLSRFDLIFIIRDLPGDSDKSMAQYILSTHMNAEYATPPPIPFLLLKKYIAYARANIKPKMTQAASDKIEEYFLQLRKMWEPGKIPVTPRTIEGLIRLSTARAKILLKSEVSAEDAEQAISLMQRMVQDVLVDPNTKQADFGQLSGMSQQQISKSQAMMDVLKEVRIGGGTVEKREFKEMLKKTGKFTDDEGAEKAIRQLYQSGRLYEVSAGKFRVISA